MLRTSATPQGIYPACSPLKRCDRFSHNCPSLAEERRNQKNYTITPLPPSLLTCRCGTPARVSSNANSLVADENVLDVMLWFMIVIRGEFYGPPFFSCAIPTYGVLPCSMIRCLLAPKSLYLGGT